jgi:hypothetical protein
MVLDGCKGCFSSRLLSFSPNMIPNLSRNETLPKDLAFCLCKRPQQLCGCRPMDIVQTQLMSTCK